MVGPLGRVSWSAAPASGVCGMWYLVYCTGPIVYPICNVYSPSGTRGPRTSPANLFVAVPAIVVTFVLFRLGARAFLTAWSTVATVYAGGRARKSPSAGGSVPSYVPVYKISAHVTSPTNSEALHSKIVGLYSASYRASSDLA